MKHTRTPVQFAFARHATDSFIPELWSARLLTALRTAHVYGGLVNRDYEGEITAYGDTVQINTVGDPTIGDYTKHTDITIEDVDTTAQTLTIDQAKYFAFEVDDIEAAQNRADVMPEAAMNAGYGLRDVADLFLGALMSTSVAAGNQIAEDTISTATEAEGVLIDLSVKLDESDVPTEGRFVVVTPAFHGLLLRSDIFVPVNTAGTDQALRNGIIGEAFGFTVAKSNNTPDGPGAGAGKNIIAGHRSSTTFAEQIVKTEAARMEKRFADLLKGLHVYGADVTRPTALAAADIIVS